MTWMFAGRAAVSAYRGVTWSLTLLVAACSGFEADRAGGTSEGIVSLDGDGTVTTASATGTRPSGSATQATTSVSAANTTSAPGASEGADSWVFDVGFDADAGPSGTGQCSGVDLLFVIDNSPSMASNIDNLVANFPAFIDGIKNGLSAQQGYHVGVTTTADALSQPGIDPACEALGTLVEHSARGDCGPFASGSNYMTEADDLAEKFACVADLGAAGDPIEVTVEAAMNAIGVTNTGPSGCNPGFIRDDALLVVVVITDEEDNAGQDSLGGPSDWLAYFGGRKGVETNVVVLSIVGGAPGATGCAAVHAPRLIAFADAFTHGESVSICEPDYGPFFDRAVQLATQAFEHCTPAL